MADLLECLIQVKALGETLEMVTGPISAGTALETGDVAMSRMWRRMAEAERRYAQALGTQPSSRPGSTSESEGAADARKAFVERRRANLAMLGDCGAAQLAGPIVWPGRPSTSVADLVAIMLANDTEVLGDLRRARQNPSS